MAHIQCSKYDQFNKILRLPHPRKWGPSMPRALSRLRIYMVSGHAMMLTQYLEVDLR